MKSHRTLHYSSFSTPAGTFSVAVDANGAVAATAFGDRQVLQSRAPDALLREGVTETAAARSAIQAWFKGRSREFPLALAPVGTPFQQRVWAALRTIPFGQTRSYGELAKALQSSARAVGRANATNPIALIVPCHRVVGADGSLTGFAFGAATKQRLLEFEAA